MRTKEDKCLICKDKNSIEKGSHLMPAGLSIPCDGGRSKEELYFIGETINVFYGSGNFKNNNIIKDTTRHSNYNVMDYIFCQSCEKKLSKIENSVIPFLTKSVPSNKGFDKEGKTEKGLLFKEYSNIDLAELKLFFYTVIWRLALAQELNFGTKVFTTEQDEKLRTIINKFLSEDLKNITQNEELQNEIPLTIITSSFEKTTMNNYSPHRINNNPPLFMVCEYLLFIHFNDYVVLNPNFGLPLEVFNKSLINKNIMPVKIAFLTDAEWHRFLEKEFQYRAKEFQEIRIHSLMNKSGNSYQECGHLLHKRTHSLQIDQLVKKIKKSRDECLKLYSEKGESYIYENNLKGYAFSFDDAYVELIEK